MTPTRVFLKGNDSRTVSLIFHTFYRPNESGMITVSPACNVCRIYTSIGSIRCHGILLRSSFRFSTSRLLTITSRQAGVVFLYSPGGPAKGSLLQSRVVGIVGSFRKLIVLSRTCGSFSSRPSFLSRLSGCPGLVVLRAFSGTFNYTTVHLKVTFTSRKVVNILGGVGCPCGIGRLARRRTVRVLRGCCRVRH